MIKGNIIELPTLIEFASEQAGKIFKKTGQLLPMYHCIKATGEMVILPSLNRDKDLSVALTKAWMAIEKIDTYVFMDEAYILDDARGRYSEADIQKAAREGLANHPDRREIIMFSAENVRGEARTAKRFILRPEIGKPKLSPLEIDQPFDNSEGRMVGLLRRTGKP